MIQRQACGQIVHMGFDFSAIDAELSTLGPEPAELATLARRFAGELGSLAEVDRALEALGVFALLEVRDAALRGLIAHWQTERAACAGKAA